MAPESAVIVELCVDRLWFQARCKSASVAVGEVSTCRDRGGTVNRDFMFGWRLQQGGEPMLLGEILA